MPRSTRDVRANRVEQSTVGRKIPTSKFFSSILRYFFKNTSATNAVRANSGMPRPSGALLRPNFVRAWSVHQPVIEPLIGMAPRVLRIAVLAAMVDEADFLLRAEQPINGQCCVHERPARVSVGAVSAQDQNRSWGAHGEHLVMLHGR